MPVVRHPARPVIGCCMMRGPRASGGDGIVRWLLPASVLHVVGVLLAAALSRCPRPGEPRLGSVEPESSVEFILLDDGQWSMTPDATSSRANPFEAAPPPASDELRLEPLTKEGRAS